MQQLLICRQRAGMLQRSTQTQKLADLSEGLLPPLQSNKLFSVGGGHTNALLRALTGNCKSAVPALAGDDGCLSAERLTVARPSLN